MDGNQFRDRPADDHVHCVDCCADLQEYLDGTLAKRRSLGIFLHLRDCDSCRREHDAIRHVIGRLDSLPPVAVPADFDRAVLASVPYAAYKALEPLRRARVPVYLEEQFLPAWVRSHVVRRSGLVFGAVSLAAWMFVRSDPAWVLLAVAGLLPEAAVRLQTVGRRVIGLRRAEG